MGSVVVVVLALAAAGFAAVGTVMRQQATTRSRTWGRRWLAGAAISVAAFALQIVALVFGSVLVVQPLIVLSVLFELFIEAWWLKRPPVRGQWVFAAGVAAGVAALVVFARPVPAETGRQAWVLDVVVVGFLGLVLGGYLVARRTAGVTSAVLFGLISGSLFGLVAVQVNGMSTGFVDVPTLIRSPTLYVCIVTAAGAIAAQQRAFARSRLAVSYPAMVASEPVVAMVLSMAVLGDKLSSHSVGSYLGVAGLVVMVCSVTGLARATGGMVDEQPVRLQDRTGRTPTRR